MKTDFILRHSVFVRYLPPLHDRSEALTVGQRVVAFAKQSWATIKEALRPATIEEVEEAYLAKAESHADLEWRMQQLQHQSHQRRVSW